jgi:uncharacterized protein (DUF2126 family)
MRLTMGGEPTFVAASDREAPEWNTDALGPTKRAYADELIRRLRDTFAPGGFLHYGQGKWYPGESLPRWAFALYWRKDGKPIWTNPELIASPKGGVGATRESAERLALDLADRLGIGAEYVIPAYEDPAYWLVKEGQLPANVDVTDPKIEDPEERARILRTFERGLTEPSGFVLPVPRSLLRLERGDADDCLAKRSKRSELFTCNPTPLLNFCTNEAALSGDLASASFE